jgi:hypothetical protein
MTKEKKLLTLIMPVFNVGDAVIPVITTLFFTVKYPFKLFIIYDFPEDPTVTTVKKLQNHFKDLYLIENELGKGVVNALKTGFKNADTEYVGIWVAYHLDPYGILNKMVEKLENEYDLVSANRFAVNTTRARGNSIKKILSFVGNFILKRIIGMPISDVTTSLKVYKKSVVESINIETKVDGGWAINAELAIKSAIKGYKMAEIPLQRKNINLIHGITNFKILKQLPTYLQWLYLGWKNRKLIRNNYLK